MGNRQSKTSDESSHVCEHPGFDTGKWTDHHSDPVTAGNWKTNSPNQIAPTTLFVGSYDFYHFNMILSGACAAFAVLSMLALMFRHATHFSQPKEQSE